jgi:hypothetical protein
MEIPNRKIVAKAKREWINTMKRMYPDFNHKLWGRSANYRLKYKQGSLTS